MLRDLIGIALKSVVLAAAGVVVVTCSPRTQGAVTAGAVAGGPAPPAAVLPLQ